MADGEITAPHKRAVGPVRAKLFVFRLLLPIACALGAVSSMLSLFTTPSVGWVLSFGLGAGAFYGLNFPVVSRDFAGGVKVLKAPWLNGSVRFLMILTGFVLTGAEVVHGLHECLSLGLPWSTLLLLWFASTGLSLIVVALNRKYLLRTAYSRNLSMFGLTCLAAGMLGVFAQSAARLPSLPQRGIAHSGARGPGAAHSEPVPSLPPVASPSAIPVPPSAVSYADAPHRKDVKQKICETDGALCDGRIRRYPGASGKRVLRQRARDLGDRDVVLSYGTDDSREYAMWLADGLRRKGLVVGLQSSGRPHLDQVDILVNPRRNA